MSNKFSIAKDIDLELLNSQIRKYYILKGHKSIPYLFMNEETMSRIGAEYIKRCDSVKNNVEGHDYIQLLVYSSDSIDTSAYVYLDNGKAFGEVEIR